MKQLEVMKRFDQFDYELFGTRDKWFLGPTINMLTSFEMDMRGYFKQEDRANIFDKIYDKYWTYITQLMLNGLLSYATHHGPGDFMMYQEDDVDVVKCIREFNTTFSKEEFFEYVIADDKLNIDIGKLRKYMSGELIPETIILPEIQVPRMIYEKVIEVKIDADSTNEVTAKEEISEADRIVPDSLSDNKYPDFKGIKFDKLTNEQFTELKQFYGIVKNEESKLRRAIPIAVKIGLLFGSLGVSRWSQYARIKINDK